MAADQDFTRMLDGYELTTAEILYHRPDFRRILQSFVWQEYDLAPRFPKLEAFLGFWEKEIEGPLHKVTVAHTRLITPREFRLVSELTRH